MTDQKIVRIGGVTALACIATFFVEFPFYFVRGTFPPVTDGPGQVAFAAHNATNIMTCVFFDFIILSLILVFAASFRHMILAADPKQEWLGTLFLTLVVVYVTITLVADCLQAATVIDALTPPGNGAVIRTLFEAEFVLYGIPALWLMGVFMAIAGYAGRVTRTLPNLAAWLAYACALGCFAFVPAIWVKHVNFTDIKDFYNPASLGVEAFASGFPLAIWMIATGVLMVRKHEPVPPVAV